MVSSCDVYQSLRCHPVVYSFLRTGCSIKRNRTQLEGQQKKTAPPPPKTPPRVLALSRCSGASTWGRLGAVSPSNIRGFSLGGRNATPPQRNHMRYSRGSIGSGWGNIGLRAPPFCPCLRSPSRPRYKFKQKTLPRLSQTGESASLNLKLA